MAACAGLSSSASNLLSERPSLIIVTRVVGTLSTVTRHSPCCACLSGAFARSVEGSAQQPHIWQSEQEESIRRRVIETVTMVALSVHELRRLLAHLQKTRTPDMSFRWHWTLAPQLAARNAESTTPIDVGLHSWAASQVRLDRRVIACTNRS